MNPVRYFQFHIGDYLSGCEEFSLLQHGAYLRLMLWYYDTGKPLPNDLIRIYRRLHATSREEQQAVDYVLGEKFVLVDNVWRHRRVEQEIERISRKSVAGKTSAEVRWAVQQARKSSEINDGADANAVQTQCVRNATQHPLPNTQQRTPPTPSRGKSSPKTETTPGFDRFWSAYPRHEKKADAAKAWVKGGCEDIADLIVGAVKSRKWSSDPKFIPMPTSYINGRRWEDETVKVVSDHYRID